MIGPLVSRKKSSFGDKGYIGKKLFDELFKNSLKLITRNLNNKYRIWHTRHRSIFNAVANLIAALAAYAIEPLNLSAVKLLKQHQPAISQG